MPLVTTELTEADFLVLQAHARAMKTPNDLGAVLRLAVLSFDPAAVAPKAEADPTPTP